MAAGNGTLPTLGTLIGSAETALRTLYGMRAQADAAKNDALSQKLAGKISDLSTCVMRLKIERTGILEADLHTLTVQLNQVNDSAEASLHDIQAIERTIGALTDFLKTADEVIARVTAW